MWESIKWLIPSVTAPTVADCLAAAAIIIVGLIVIRFIIRPLLFKIADLFNKKIIRYLVTLQRVSTHQYVTRLFSA